MARIDYENLRRVLMLGVTDAVKDAGITHAAITISVTPAVAITSEGVEPAAKIAVEVAELTEEEARALASEMPS